MLNKENLLRNLRNIVGWQSSRKIVVFESDDWGSIRMPSKNAYKRLEQKGLAFDRRDSKRFNQYDSLATSGDLENLFELLEGFKDKNGAHPVFTAMSVMANPAFDKIKENGFTSYDYEPFTETLNRYPGCENSFNLWKEGMQKGLFVPQMHGREHLNVFSWMNALKAGDKDTLLAFEEGLWSFVPDKKKLANTYFQQAFALKDIAEIEEQREILKTGLDLFVQFFGYRATYFVPPNGVLNNALNSTLVKNGIKLRSTTKIQKEPVGEGTFKKRLHYLGQKDRNGLTYIIRNCTFEPSNTKIDWVDNCLKEIEASFKWNKPAIIGSHRVNYIGAISKDNRSNGLNQLNELLTRTLKAWPDVEFMTTAQLGDLMLKKN
ncbi:hypothetical protein E9993_08895 [Labilibacter sediminis]|nr:hypothetical protein E9993_08895 [Labilibacter sediminis]